MESPRKFNDCYFYYYSTCTKGDNCVFRHEPSALGCETMCSAWQQGKCLDKKCRLRHMELRKNRKQIPCYWENQPGGCRKKHCPFMHKNPDARTDGIAPSQPGPPAPIQSGAVVETVVEQPMAVPPTGPPVGPVPLLWQQQRQVVLDSAILGVLPASSDILGGRRVLPPHEAPPPNPYAPLPVDPLVVNFEEESDNESAPSSTPTKNVMHDATQPAGSKSQELLLLEKIQAEAAAYYSYEELPQKDVPNERKIVRTNLNTKYDRLSLDELSGKMKVPEKRSSLDFKVLSLDEIRAKKLNSCDAIIHPKPITVNLNRKRKLSSQETIIDSGNKIIKLIRSNSIVYKKVDKNVPNAPAQAKSDPQLVSSENSRKRTFSEQSDVYEVHDDELLDDECFKFKKIKVGEQIAKPLLIRNKSTLSESENIESEPKENVTELSNTIDNSDSEVQIVDEDNEIIDLDEPARTAEPIDIVDLSDSDVSDIDIELIHNVPDVVASCQSKCQGKETDIVGEIDAILSDCL